MGKAAGRSAGKVGVAGTDAVEVSGTRNACDVVDVP